MPLPQDPNPLPPATPPTLNHVIGQRQVIDKLKVALDASFADNQPFPHTLLLGPPGLGKTMLAKLIASELASEFHEGLGQSLATPSILNGFLLKPQHDKAVHRADSDDPCHAQVPETDALLRGGFAGTLKGKSLIRCHRSSGGHPSLTHSSSSSTLQRVRLPSRMACGAW